MKRVITSKRAFFGACLIAALLALAPVGARAQLSRADSAAVLLAAGNDFAASGRWEVAEAIYQHLIERYAGTTAAGSAQARIGGVRESGTQGAGRIELQVWSTTYGLFLGVMVPMALGAENAEPYGLGLLLGGPAGFLGGRSLARSRGLTEGQARAITWGGVWGTWQGFGWATVLDLGSEQICYEGYCYESGDNAQEIAGAVIAGGVAGIVVGNVLSRRTISPGTATAVNLGSLWGSWFGLAIGVLADQDDDALLGATLIGGNVGLLSTALLAPGWNVTRSRARLVSIAGVVGGVGGFGLDLLIQPDDEKVAVAIPLVTSVIGLGIGIAGTRGRDFPEGTGSEAGSALLNLRQGSWSVGTPLPTPIATEIETPQGYRRGMALSLPLLKGSF